MGRPIDLTAGVQNVVQVDDEGAYLNLSATPVGVAYTDRSIANLAGSSEQLMAANASRRILIIYTSAQRVWPSISLAARLP